jgi:uncharacterized protein (TIGR00251 family)
LPENKDIQEVIFDVRVIPRSSKNVIVGFHENLLKIKITASPVEGEANRECIKFLAKTFGVSRSSVTVIRGEKSRKKRICIQGIDQKRFLDILLKEKKIGKNNRL